MARPPRPGGRGGLAEPLLARVVLRAVDGLYIFQYDPAVDGPENDPR